MLCRPDPQCPQLQGDCGEAVLHDYSGRDMNRSSPATRLLREKRSVLKVGGNGPEWIRISFSNRNGLRTGFAVQDLL